MKLMMFAAGGHAPRLGVDMGDVVVDIGAVDAGGPKPGDRIEDIGLRDAPCHDDRNRTCLDPRPCYLPIAYFPRGPDIAIHRLVFAFSQRVNQKIVRNRLKQIGKLKQALLGGGSVRSAGWGHRQGAHDVDLREAVLQVNLQRQEGIEFPNRSRRIHARREAVTQVNDVRAVVLQC